jgi:hypothetical protein
MIILIVILYSVVGFFVCLYLYTTWEGFTPDWQDKFEARGCSFLAVPEIAILALLIWPVFVLVRIYRLVLK